MEAGQQATSMLNANPALPRPRLPERKITSERGAGQIVPAKALTIPASKSNVANAGNQLALGASSAREKRSEGQLPTGTIIVDRHADLSGLEPVPRRQVMELPLEITSAPDTRVTALRTGAGLVGLESHRNAGESGPISRSFVQSGKSTAAFFTKVGSSIKRAF